MSGHLDELARSKGWTVTAEKTVRYDVILTGGLFDPESRVFLESSGTHTGGGIRRFIVIDRTVDELHGARIRAYLDHHEVRYKLLTLEVSEQNKTLELVSVIVRALDEYGIDRHEPIVAIGGGVLLDMVGVAAGLYRRGTRYVRVPTTLVGLIDAGIGAKTGINHDGYKNRLGAYHPPVAALLDRTFLATLDERHLANGMAEILKMALIRDRDLFDLLAEHAPLLVAERFQGRTPAGDRAACEVVRHAVGGMLDELAHNLWEHTLARPVDFGHSISPAIEMSALPELLHGEAVAIDMAVFVVIACRRGLVSPEDRDRILALIVDLGLPVEHPRLDRSLLRGALAETVRHRGGMARLPLPVGIGSVCFVDDVTESELMLAVKELRELGGEDAERAGGG
jgi:3-dehydroquinate synthase